MRHPEQLGAKLSSAAMAHVFHLWLFTQRLGPSGCEHDHTGICRADCFGPGGALEGCLYLWLFHSWRRCGLCSSQRQLSPHGWCVRCSFRPRWCDYRLGICRSLYLPGKDVAGAAGHWFSDRPERGAVFRDGQTIGMGGSPWRFCRRLGCGPSG